ncbi:hypothetical protein A6A05_13060 [Magnetospirillum moscoviense]|uniref:Acetyl xylan esterase domain-containing protein n=2 Tax=Magnetospirillum moscoviense TaxID=1437059 RepID=A0A178MP26_9PROT|nr:hypothetical protein A6A05_13060 [Magnetospirillum moscoviense]
MALYAKYIEGQPNLAKRPKSLDGIHPGVKVTDFHHLNTLGGPEDVARRRQMVTDYVWRGFGLPFGVRPDKVEHAVAFPPLMGISNLASVDRLTIEMPYGIKSVAFVLHPDKARSCLMIYQEGHLHSFLERRGYLEKVVAGGCTALALSLPLTGGINNQPTIDHPRFGVLNLLNVDALELLHTRTFSAMGFYLTPVIVGLNHLLAEHSFDRVGMTGFSGGGWVTVMAAALDQRIQRSYPVAGTATIPVFAAEPGWGDWVQRDGRLYDIVTYTELYVLGTVQPARRQLQVFNLRDECCFRGRNAEAYAPAVADKAQALGGSFAAIIRDDGEVHDFTEGAQAGVLADFFGSAVAGTNPSPDYR